MGERKNFADAIGELLAKTAAVCAVCESGDRATIEAARKRGASFQMIASALQMVGTIDPNVTVETAAKRVKQHFSAHATKKGGGSK